MSFEYFESIICRAKNIMLPNEWVQGYFYFLPPIYPSVKEFYPDGKYCILKESGQEIWVNPHTVCPCLGITDKNGSFVFANDIVVKESYADIDAYANSEKYVGVVKYENFAWIIETKNKDGDWIKKPLFEMEKYGISNDLKHLKVVGNTFDNPGLLEDLLKGNDAKIEKQNKNVVFNNESNKENDEEIDWDK